MNTSPQTDSGWTRQRLTIEEPTTAMRRQYNPLACIESTSSQLAGWIVRRSNQPIFLCPEFPSKCGASRHSSILLRPRPLPPLSLRSIAQSWPFAPHYQTAARHCHSSPLGVFCRDGGSRTATADESASANVTFDRPKSSDVVLSISTVLNLLLRLLHHQRPKLLFLARGNGHALVFAYRDTPCDLRTSSETTFASEIEARASNA